MLTPRVKPGGLGLLFPALFDGQPPESRPPLEETSAADLLRAWGAD